MDAGAAKACICVKFVSDQEWGAPGNKERDEVDVMGNVKCWKALTFLGGELCKSSGLSW